MKQLRTRFYTCRTPARFGCFPRAFMKSGLNEIASFVDHSVLIPGIRKGSWMILIIMNGDPQF